MSRNKNIPTTFKTQEDMYETAFFTNTLAPKNTLTSKSSTCSDSGSSSGNASYNTPGCLGYNNVQSNSTAAASVLKQKMKSSNSNCSSCVSPNSDVADRNAFMDHKSIMSNNNTTTSTSMKGNQQQSGNMKGEKGLKIEQPSQYAEDFESPQGPHELDQQDVAMSSMKMYHQYQMLQQHLKQKQQQQQQQRQNQNQYHEQNYNQNYNQHYNHSNNNQQCHQKQPQQKRIHHKNIKPAWDMDTLKKNICAADIGKGEIKK